MRYLQLTNAIVIVVISNFALACSSKETMNRDTTIPMADTLPAAAPVSPAPSAPPTLVESR